MGYYEFPHTRNYDTDLGYLINKYQELDTEVKNINVDGLKSDVDSLKIDNNTNKQNIATNTTNIEDNTNRITALENADFLTNVKIKNSTTITASGGNKVNGVQEYTLNVIGSTPVNLSSNLSLLNNDSELPILKSSTISLDSVNNKIKLSNTAYINGIETPTDTNINLSTEQFKIETDTLKLAKNYLELDTANTRFNEKQDLLVSGTNIKSINNTSLLGEGNIDLATMAQVNEAINNAIGTAINANY